MAKAARILIYYIYLYPMLLHAVGVAGPPKIEHKGNRLVYDFLGDFECKKLPILGDEHLFCIVNSWLRGKNLNFRPSG